MKISNSVKNSFKYLFIKAGLVTIISMFVLLCLVVIGFISPMDSISFFVVSVFPWYLLILDIILSIYIGYILCISTEKDTFALQVVIALEVLIVAIAYFTGNTSFIGLNAELLIAFLPFIIGWKIAQKINYKEINLSDRGSYKLARFGAILFALAIIKMLIS